MSLQKAPYLKKQVLHLQIQKFSVIIFSINKGKNLLKNKKIKNFSRIRATRQKSHFNFFKKLERIKKPIFETSRAIQTFLSFTEKTQTFNKNISSVNFVFIVFSYTLSLT